MGGVVRDKTSIIYFSIEKEKTVFLRLNKIRKRSLIMVALRMRGS